MDLQFLGFLRPFYMYNNNLYPKSSRNYVLLRAGLNKDGQSCPFGQKGWIGRPWLARPSKGHNFWNFLGINSYSTRKKVSNKPKFGGPLIFEHFKSRFLKSELFKLLFEERFCPNLRICTAVSTWFLADKSTDFLTQKNHKLNISNRDYLLTSCNQEQSHVDHE